MIYTDKQSPLSLSPLHHAYIIRESSDRVPSSPLQISRSPYRNPLLSGTSNEPPRTLLDFPLQSTPSSTNSRFSSTWFVLLFPFPSSNHLPTSPFSSFSCFLVSVQVQTFLLSAIGFVGCYGHRISRSENVFSCSGSF